MNYDFIEIGTSDFETLIQSSTDEIGLSIDTVNLYLNRLPNKEKVTKLNHAISNYSGITQVYYVEPEDIESNNLSWYLKGCNSIGEPHPVTLRELKERSLEHLLKIDEVEVLTWKDLVERYNIESVKTLKIDAEGHDTIIVNNILEEGHNVYPETIIFEANELTPDQTRIDTINKAKSVGYSFIEFNAKRDVILKYNSQPKVLLIEVWLGPLPDYYQFHKETITKQNEIFDIYFFTDQEVDISNLPSNYNIIPLNIEELKQRFSRANNRELQLLGGNKKITDLKFSYFVNMFSDIIDYSKYDYFGIFDIDTLMGDLYNWVNPYLGEYDFISTGGENFHNRLGGPLLIFKNDPEILNQFQTERYYNIFDTKEIYGIGEKDLNDWATQNKKVKVITYSQNLEEESGKVIYGATWVGGKTYCKDKEIMLHHFYNKPYTKLSFRGNSIISEYKKVYLEDFYWVTHFTKNYESLLQVLINSIEQFSNRKCILYTINYTSDLAFKLSDQFIVRRLDVELGELNARGKYDNVLSLKPSILTDVVEYLPESKFVYVDTDISLTVNADSIVKYFKHLEGFPLINSHTHDRIVVMNLIEGEEWSSPLNILADVTGDPVHVYPRRKTNVIVFDKTCKWFFEEQINLFNTYKNTKPGIFALHDEDSANLLINRYNYRKCLPLVDIEEIPYVDMEIFHNYKYGKHPVSDELVLPQHENDLIAFHGFKNPEFQNQLKENYFKTILSQDDFLIEYKNNSFWWTKNSFLGDKNLQPVVRFEILNNDQILYTLNYQEIFKYWSFFLSDLFLNSGYYETRIVEEYTNKIIYTNIIKV
jgi:FkbM family methyltransferase